MNTNVLLNKLDALELKGILPKVANEKIQELLFVEFLEQLFVRQVYLH